MENNFLYKNKNIFYRITGKGRPVVLLHGFGEDGKIWDDLANTLEKNYRVIIPDLPGSGKSEMLEGENISIEDYADVIKEILNIESFKFSPKEEDLDGAGAAFSMIGHSMGGYVTLAFAEKYPEQLNALGLFHSSAFADDEQKIETRLKGIEFIKNNGAYAFLKTSIPGLFTGEFRKNQPEQVDKFIEAAKKFKDEALIQYYHAMINRPDRTEILKTFKKPILFIIGEKDQAIPLQSSLKQCHLPSLSYINILANTAHMGMIEEVEKCKTIIEMFLDQANSK